MTVPVHRVADAVLAQRACRGDDQAFAELARRYRRLIAHSIRRRAFGLTYEELRQEALIGLFAACRADDPSKGDFGAIATTCIRRRVWTAKAKAQARKHRVLSEAVGLDYREHPDAPTLAERLPAGDASDPARVVLLREELRERAADYRPPRRRRRNPNPIPRRRYTQEEIATALRLLAEGKTQREAAAAVGACHHSVQRWSAEAA